MTTASAPAAPQAAPGAAREPRRRPPLVRPRAVLLGGVSLALATHLGAPLALIRILFAVPAVIGTVWAVVTLWLIGAPSLTLLGFVPVLLYGWLWVLVPRTAATPDAARTRRAPVAVLLFSGGVLLALLTPLSWAPSARPLPIGLVESVALLLAAFLWAATVDARDPVRAVRAPLVRSLVAGFVILFGAVLMFAAFRSSHSLAVVVAALLVLLGVAGFVVPAIVARWSARSAERAAHAREEQRAEIAAHLHDSVLQTLAIIQNRAGAGSEVARIARAQERELRDWLFAGTDPFAGDLATALRTMARELELEHAVRIEVVTVGEVAAVESHALAAAAREALVNAARHAGGDVTVYAEATPDAVEVFVRDRGAGFDADAVPAGRLGIRESIVGRMARAGGTAVVVSGPDGTEVQLRMPRRALGAKGGTA
ncbi:ATP-binding protein [Protaetiibacter intestinalis]|uniref:ATP-binding protein n=1 Tax=Protaetiibacter intestinalis TaxID=2419774 RepID=A0A387B3H1_9MICO|nr:ATP-binding protein [Protaetiibacter intestinalis]AYF98154.1 ATP-binding protein [Protaetiibacter intestinalis]